MDARSSEGSQSSSSISQFLLENYRMGGAMHTTPHFPQVGVLTVHSLEQRGGGETVIAVEVLEVVCQVLKFLSESFKFFILCSECNMHAYNSVSMPS